VTLAPRFLTVLLLGSVAACGGPRVPGQPTPASPEATVGQFMAAVNADDLHHMALLFGDERGPSTVIMKNAAHRDSIMAVLQHVLVADSIHVTGTAGVPGHPAWRLVHVDVTQGSRETSVPFTLVPWQGGWLVWNVGILPLMPGGASRPTP